MDLFRSFAEKGKEPYHRLSAKYMVVLLFDNTTKEEATGLAAYLHLVLQLSKDLGTQWLKYNKDFREWAAAKSLRKWEELKFPIYGHCLAAQQKQTWFLPAAAKEPPRESLSKKRLHLTRFLLCV